MHEQSVDIPPSICQWRHVLVRLADQQQFDTSSITSRKGTVLWLC